MLKQVIIFDVLIGLISTVIIQLIFKAYGFIFLLGLAMASISFFISGVSVESKLLNKKKSYATLLSIANFSKVFIICIIGVALFNNNINNVISYSMGFTSHFIALFLYGIVNFLNERK
ncbi:hypothetical protein HMPREF1982_04486 [Clostridiales bacterium oral taxon 876 str. F0540]|nr:hypothetical protein HMPREF1982_04486 [Clostridiales bacterium oral taxon 876 str. F0540]